MARQRDRGVARKGTSAVRGERAPGPGRLWRRGDAWAIDYRDAEGRRRRKLLGPDKRVAERRRQELINQRNMQLDGLGAVEGMTLTLDEILGVYLEDLGARVSPRHANFIENTGGATAEDVRKLIDKMRGSVKDKFGIDLELEVWLAGE